MTLKASDVCVGDYLISDGSFPCIKPGSILEVKRHLVYDPDDHSLNGLYVDCFGGDLGYSTPCEHFLDGQVDDGIVVGFELYWRP